MNSPGGPEPPFSVFCGVAAAAAGGGGDAVAAAAVAAAAAAAVDCCACCLRMEWPRVEPQAPGGSHSVGGIECPDWRPLPGTLARKPPSPTTSKIGSPSSRADMKVGDGVGGNGGEAGGPAAAALAAAAAAGGIGLVAGGTDAVAGAADAAAVFAAAAAAFAAYSAEAAAVTAATGEDVNVPPAPTGEAEEVGEEGEDWVVLGTP